MRSFFVRTVIVLFACCYFQTAFSQLPSLPANLSNVTAAQVSEEQVKQVVNYIRQNNITDQQVYDQLLSRGMSAVEAASLRSRVQKGLLEIPSTPVPSNNGLAPSNSNARYQEKEQVPIVVNNPRKIFGLEIFNNGVLSFEPNLKIATPVNYVLGPDDEVVVNIYGYQEAKYNLTVSPEGDITIPNVGIIYVAGLTIEQASAKIKARLTGSGYAYLRSGLTKLNVSVGRIRSIKVTVLGEVRKPGSYSIPSLSTAFNALYLSGGPNEIGSMRNIQIIRGGKVIETLDIYDFLVKGDLKGNIMLRDQDVLRIPPYQVRVSMEGEVKRSGLFEVASGENLQQVLDFAGGFSDSAFTASITAYRSTDTEKLILDISREQFNAYKPARAEAFIVKRIIERFTNKVSIRGGVYLPGDFELTTGMTVRALLQKAQGLREDALVDRGIIYRYGNDLTPEYVSFNPGEIMRNPAADIVLRRNDEVIISSLADVREQYNISINGEVRRPGNFTYVANMSVKDVVLLAGGFTDAAIPQRIEIARRLKRDSFNIQDVQIAEVIDITSVDDLNITSNDIKLQPNDVVVVRRNPGYRPQVNVRIEGEVIYPGAYVLQNKNERISDVIKRAGGFTLDAYTLGGYISRVNSRSVINQLNADKVSKIQQQLKDSSNSVVQEVSRPVDQIAINLDAILGSPGSKDDLILEEGDVLTIPKEKSEVRISGEVLFPTRVVYERRMDLRDYIGRSGGFTDNARKLRVYILYPNGSAAKTSSFLFFKSYPKVTPGAEIIVPKKHVIERRKLSTGEVIGITTALTALAAVLIQIK